MCEVRTSMACYMYLSGFAGETLIPRRGGMMEAAPLITASYSSQQVPSRNITAIDTCISLRTCGYVGFYV